LFKGIQKIMKEKGPVHLVICGKQTNDGDTGHVGPGIAAWLDWPNIAYVKKVESVDDKKIVVHRMMEDGVDVLEMDLPAVIAVVKEINEPRVAGLKGKMAAKKAVIPKWNEADIEADKKSIGLGGSPTIVAKSFNPPPTQRRRQNRRRDGSGQGESLGRQTSRDETHLTMPNTIFRHQKPLHRLHLLRESVSCVVYRHGGPSERARGSLAETGRYRRGQMYFLQRLCGSLR
jgi:hypothetical protein